MSLLNKNFVLIIIFFVLSCKVDAKKEKKNNLVITSSIVDTIQQLEEPVIQNKESLSLFLDRVKKASKSENENDLKSIVKFPLIGHGLDENGNSFKDTFSSIEDLKVNPLVFYVFFKEYLKSGIEIKTDKTLGKNSYHLESTEKVSYSFKLQLIKGKYFITEFEIPGA